MSTSTTSAKKARSATRAPSKSAQPLPVQLVALDDIDPSPLNRDSRNIDELVASVREHGVQQPIKLRPQGSRFEIVYGERRFRAAKKVGLKAIPATVEKLTDEEAHELRIVENACRENPHPMEEAEAYEDLLAMKGARGKPFHTAESLAELVGRSAQYVYARLKLTALGPAMRKAFWGGELTTGAAFLVARAIPLVLQEEALAEFREAFAEGEEGAAFPTEELAHLIEQKYLTRLDRAPFSLKDAKLVREAGACTTCAKRSGNQPALFPDDTPKDTCTDAVCFRSKLGAHRQKLGEDVVAKGGAVLTEHQSNEIYKGTVQLPWNSKYVDADLPCYDDPERRTWRKLLGDLCPKPTLATDPTGVPHALLLKADALAALEQAGVEFGRRLKAPASAPGTPDGLSADTSGEAGQDPSEPVDAAAARAAALVRRVTISNVLAAIVAAAEARPADDPTFASLIFEAMAHGGYHDAIADTVKRRGLERGKGEAPETTLTAHARSLDGRGLRALILELALARGAYFAWSTKYSERTTAAAAAYAVDLDAIEKASGDQIAARRAERAARKAKKVAA
ncbi:ParB/RepB/Spo0J family partition protein [Anaeromyxobacter oryzisoli]|uniref:ParB/RepB/Spo0J family partition protein n=1 Tax=Anaeromyxobacter oryzisoli TaxID=2925408 RepID=UPI001F57240E|nr:ParB/RepB/Spo0J family partition protein [Anaeromyxobacter sp. SG63]